MKTGEGASLKKTLESYMHASACLVCRAKLPPPSLANSNPAIVPLPLCTQCASKPARTLLVLRERMRKAEEKVKNLDLVCRSCSGLAFGEEVRCDSRDCPVFYSRVREKARLGSLKGTVGDVVEEIERREEIGNEGLAW